VRRWPLLGLAALSAAVMAGSTAIAATSSNPPHGAQPAATKPQQPVASSPLADVATSSGATVVRFVYAPQVLVQLDKAGRPWRVKTNTGKAPVSGDQLDVADVSGRPIPATPALRAAVANVIWTGDWSAVGSWHPWPAGS
jgi:hypothetical protein